MTTDIFSLLNKITNMDNISILFAKIAALKKSIESVPYDSMGRTGVNNIEPFLSKANDLIEQVIKELPQLYSDLPEVKMPVSIGLSQHGKIFRREDINPLLRNLDYILEVRSNSRIGERSIIERKGDSIFISHGKSPQWHKVQNYVEKNLLYKTIELAQQPNLGRTVLQKLDDEAEKCHCCIIVMTGDDNINGTEIRARENVLHEIGFMQGKLGLGRIILLHEEGVNIPSNIHGLVYIPFPKDTVEATFGALQTELKVIYGV